MSDLLQGGEMIEREMLRERCRDSLQKHLEAFLTSLLFVTRVETLFRSVVHVPLSSHCQQPLILEVTPEGAAGIATMLGKSDQKNL